MISAVALYKNYKYEGSNEETLLGPYSISAVDVPFILEFRIRGEMLIVIYFSRARVGKSKIMKFISLPKGKKRRKKEGKKEKSTQEDRHLSLNITEAAAL